MHRLIMRVFLMLSVCIVFCGCSAKTIPADQQTDKDYGPDDRQSAGRADQSEKDREEAMSIQIETVSTETFSMDYFKFGHGTDTFVILPGLSVQSVMGFAESVADAYQGFADDYTVYVFDRRKDLPETYSVHDMAADTAEAFRQLGLRDIDLFGASQGGMIAMEIAIGHPDLIRKAVLGSTSSRVEDAQYETVEKWIRLAEAGDKTGLYLAFGEAIYPEAVFEQSRQLLEDASETVTDEDLERFIILAEGMRGFDVSGELVNITCPVLVIGSKDDRVLGADASIAIAENLKDQTGPVLYMYDGYGHAVYDMAPDYKEKLLEFYRP